MEVKRTPYKQWLFYYGNSQDRCSCLGVKDGSGPSAPEPLRADRPNVRVADAGYAAFCGFLAKIPFVARQDARIAYDNSALHRTSVKDTVSEFTLHIHLRYEYSILSSAYRIDKSSVYSSLFILNNFWTIEHHVDGLSAIEPSKLECSRTDRSDVKVADADYAAFFAISR